MTKNVQILETDASPDGRVGPPHDPQTQPLPRTAYLDRVPRLFNLILFRVPLTGAELWLSEIRHQSVQRRHGIFASCRYRCPPSLLPIV